MGQESVVKCLSAPPRPAATATTRPRGPRPETEFGTKIPHYNEHLQNLLSSLRCPLDQTHSLLRLLVWCLILPGGTPQLSTIPDPETSILGETDPLTGDSTNFVFLARRARYSSSIFTQKKLRVSFDLFFGSSFDPRHRSVDTYGPTNVTLLFGRAHRSHG